MAQTGSGKTTREKQVRFRLNAAEDAHLRTAAEDAGFDNFSDYLRAVLLEKNVVVVGPRGVVLVPASAADKNERVDLESLLARLLDRLSALDEEEPNGASPGAAVEVEPAASSLPSTSPGGGDGLVGTSSSQGPLPARADAPAAGLTPDPEETSPPTNVFDDQASSDVSGDGGEPEFKEVQGPLGPVLRDGETAETYIERRTEELKQESRPIVVARYEAEAELRRIAVGQLTAAPVPTPGPVPCSQCGTLKRQPGSCPDCGAA